MSFPLKTIPDAKIECNWAYNTEEEKNENQKKLRQIINGYNSCVHGLEEHQIAFNERIFDEIKMFIYGSTSQPYIWVRIQLMKVLLEIRQKKMQDQIQDENRTLIKEFHEIVDKFFVLFPNCHNYPELDICKKSVILEIEAVEASVKNRSHDPHSINLQLKSSIKNLKSLYEQNKKIIDRCNY